MGGLQDQLENSKIWESDFYILQIEKMYKSYRVVIFSRSEGKLNFAGSVFYSDINKFEKFLNKLNMKPTNKSLVLRDSNET